MNVAADVLSTLAATDYHLSFDSLRSVQVEVSSACNLRCPQCFNLVPEHVTGLLTPAMWEERIKPYLASFGSVHLVGIGEPLLNRHFFTFLADAAAAGCGTFTTSNLQLVTPDIADRLVASGLGSLSFSCDGATKETYEKIRLRGRLERLTGALESIVAAKQRQQKATPILTLNFGGTVENIADLPAVVELAARYGVASVIAYHNVAYLEANKDVSLFHHQAMSDQYFSQAAAIAQRHGVQFMTPGLFCQPIHYDGGDIHCGYPFGHVYIYSDGRVGPCCMDFPNRIILGDLREKTLPEIWNDEPIRRLRREMTEGPSDTCKYCVSHFRMDITNPRYLFRFPGSDAYIAQLEGN